MALGEEESSSSARFVQNTLNLRLASVHFRWVELARNLNINTKKHVQLSYIFIILGGNKPHKSFCAIDLRLGC
jgi:hypothetical protein